MVLNLSNYAVFVVFSKLSPNQTDLNRFVSDRFVPHPAVKNPAEAGSLILFDSLVRKLELTPQTLRRLKSNGIYNIRHLTRRIEVDLLKIPTLRKSVIKELKETLEELGLSLSYIQEHSGIRPGTH